MKWKISISVLWFVFAVLFLILAVLHFAQSKEAIPKIEVRKYPSDDIMSIRTGEVLIQQRLMDFTDDYNEHLANQNESNRKTNLYACYGYLLAGLTALVSMVLVWQEYFLALLAKIGLIGEKARERTENV